MTWRFFAAIGLISLSACATAPKTSTGEYAYTDSQIRQNQTDLGYSAGTNSEQFPVAAATGAASAALVDSVIANGQQGVTTPHIDGVCVVAADSQESACVGVTLILTDSLGDEVGRTHTSASGAFLFPVSGRSRYVIKPLSAHYSMKSDPQGPLVAGSHVNLRLQIE